MTTYTELTDTVAEQWETALKQLADVQTGVLAPWIRTASGLVPDVEVPFADRLPSQKEVVEANFRLAERALDAQRSYVVGLFETATAAAETAPDDTKKKTTSAKK